MTPEDVGPIFGYDARRDRERPVEIRDVAPGLWLWRLEHPHWKPGQGWDPIVACTCVVSRDEVLVLDPGRVGNWRGRSESPSEPRFQLPPHHT